MLNQTMVNLPTFSIRHVDLFIGIIPKVDKIASCLESMRGVDCVKFGYFVPDRCNTHLTLRTQEWEPMTITLQALSLVEKAELVQVCFTLRLRDQRSMWMQDGCQVYMVSNGSCFMVTWIIFKNHPLEVGQTQNRWETMTLRMLTTVDLFYFIMCEVPRI
jgi:hypothetical protein